MANFVPYPRHRAKDGTTRLFIKLHHKGGKKLLKTEIILTDADLTKAKKIKSLSVKQEVDDIIKSYRSTLQKLGAAKVESMSLEEVYSSLINVDGKVEAPDFFEYVNSIIEKFIQNGSKGMAANYRSALNAFKEFSGVSRISINEINGKLVSEFANYLKNADSKRYRHEKVKNSGRALTLYLSILRAIINRARAEYNDEDKDQVVIRVNPFAKYKIPKEVRPPQRALSIEKIRAIRDLELGSEMVRAKMARDCFMLSFYMIGMNSADLFDHPPIIDGRITYERKKTRTRREDKALISVKVEPEAEVLFSKYDFTKLYASPGTFNSAINQGLKQVGKLIGEQDLTFYAARHSWATIAVNDCEIDKYLVHSALNHADDTMRITDIYVKKDWSSIDRANRKVLDYLLLG